MTKIYFIRHGETDWNVEGRFQGIENIPLNDNGRRQAEDCGRMLRETGISFDCIVSSPLDRAFYTARTIAQYLEIEEVVKDDKLIERDFGKISGRKREEREQLLQLGEELEVEEESLVAQRMKEVLSHYTARNHAHIIMVSHGASIRALLGCYAKPGSPAATAVQRNACLSTLVLEDGSVSLEAFDKTPLEYVREYGQGGERNAGYHNHTNHDGTGL